MQASARTLKIYMKDKTKAQMLHAKMISEGMKDGDAMAWFNDLDGIGIALNNLDMIIGLEWHGDFLSASYWSDKIKHIISVDSDAYKGFDNLADLSDYIAELDDEAIALEKKLTPLV